MQLKDLIEKPINEIADAELDDRLNALKRLRIIVVKPPTSKGGSRTGKTITSNKDKQIADLLSKLSPEDIKKLLAASEGG